MTKIPISVQHFIGTSTDTKPTGVPTGSDFYEYDTGLTYKTYDGTNWAAMPLVGNYVHLAGSAQVKAGKGVLHAVIINRADTTAGAIITVFDSLTGTGTVIAIISMDKAVYVVPATLAYNVSFATGLYLLFSHEVTADVTVSYN